MGHKPTNNMTVGLPSLKLFGLNQVDLEFLAKEHHTQLRPD